jgi:hypothetical protein
MAEAETIVKEVQVGLEYGSAEEILLVEELCACFPEAGEANPHMLRLIVEVTLRFRFHDKASAQERVWKYLSWRQDHFGDLESQSVVDNEELQEQLKAGLFYISPLKMSDGSALLFIRLRNHKPTEYPSPQTLRMWHYLIMVQLSKNPFLAAKGFTFINNMEDASMANTDFNVMQGVAKGLSKCLPIRLNIMVIANAPWLIRVVVPVMKNLFSNKIAQRIHLLDNVSDLPGLVSSPVEVSFQFHDSVPVVS